MSYSKPIIQIAYRIYLTISREI